MAEMTGIICLSTRDAERQSALEALWSATKADWPGGYSPEFTAAVQRLKKLEETNG